VTATIPLRYRAFLSYSHHDKAWGKWLHAALESYRIDKDLVGRDTPVGPVPKTLRPIFRDREDFSAGHSLNEQTIAALEGSAALIVVCSPSAAQSKYVNEEVRRFKMLGRPERVIPVIVNGEPGFPARECFPPALRNKVDADGEIAAVPEEPVAADVRVEGDGKEMARRKVIAGLLGIGLDEIVRRAERARRRRTRLWTGLTAILFALTVAASGSSMYAWQQLKINEAFLGAMLKRATGIVDEAVVQAQRYNLPRAATLRLLLNAEGLFDDLAQFGQRSPELRYEKAWMLIQFARNYEILGDTEKQSERVKQALHLLQELASEYPDTLKYERDKAVVYDQIARVLIARGMLNEALLTYQKAFAERHRLADREPGNADSQRDLLISYSNMGNVLLAQGDLTNALYAYLNGVMVAERLAKENPGNPERQDDLAGSYSHVAQVLMTQGDLSRALLGYRATVSIREQLSKSEPNDGGRRRELAVSYAHVADVLLAQRDVVEALRTYRLGTAILERLVDADPGNAVWQRDLSITYDKIGNAFWEQGKLGEAMQAYAKQVEIVRRLVKMDPTNFDRLRDLVTALNRIGNVFFAQGKLGEAEQAYRVCAGMSEQLAKKDQSNAEWQRDFAASLSKLAGVHLKRNEAANSLAELHKAREIMANLIMRSPNNAQWRNDLDQFDRDISVAEAQRKNAGVN
jgi:tetratricopeptide (TPR) repeat protein